MAGDAEELGGADDVAGVLEGGDAEAALGGLEVEGFKDELRHGFGGSSGAAPIRLRTQTVLARGK